MLDIKFIRENPEVVKKAIKDKQLSGTVDIDELLKIDSEIREVELKLNDLRQKRNDLNDKIKTVKDASERDSYIKENSELKPQVQELEAKLSELVPIFNEKMLWVPNVPAEDVPYGEGEEDNVEIAAWIPDIGYLDSDKIGKGHVSKSYMPQKLRYAPEGYEPLDHLTIGENLNVIDVKQSAKVSGSRFCYISGGLAVLQYALLDLVIKKVISEKYEPIVPPVLLKEEALYGTSHFPQGKDQVYKVENKYLESKDELFLVGSSEPSMFAYYMDRTLDSSKMPYKKFAYTPCFRTEVGSWGKDVKGIKRVHQFDKLELNIVCKEDQEEKIFEELYKIDEWIYQQLELPYRIWKKCTADLGYYASAKQVDMEIWLPSQKNYIEVSSVTNTKQYQSRRLGIKYKDENGASKFVSTLNATGIPVGRMLIAIIENYQNEKGEIVVPEVLRKYTGFDLISNV